MEFVFWFSFAFVLYVYFGYPLLLVLLRSILARPVRKAHFQPRITVVIAAHNERENIETKLQNCLDLDYPKDKLQIIVSLDGETDGTTGFLVRNYAQRGVELVHSKEHRGKAVALNRAMRRATGDVVVFADVRQTFERTALSELAANFADPSVGAVSGELFLGGQGAADIGLYWRYEKAIRAVESDIHSVVGATGAIYAIRRELFQELPDDTILDDVLIPLRIVLGGRRAVFDPAAKAYDQVACCPMAEYRRKVRTLTGNYQLLIQLPQLLRPWHNPVFAQFLSHKLGRLLVPYALVGMLVSNLFLLGTDVYSLFFAIQCAWYAFAAAGYLLSQRDVVEAPPVLDEQRKAA